MKNLTYYLPQNCKNFNDNIDEILCEINWVKKGKKQYISNIPCVFDIEVSSFYNSNNEKQCCMYAWVFGLNGRCIRGRTWKEFLDLIDYLVKVYELNNDKRLIIYVHNLSYEFQFIMKYFVVIILGILWIPIGVLIELVKKYK